MNKCIDNFELFREFLNFSKEDYYYNIKIIVRAKDVGKDSPYLKSFTTHNEHVVSWFSIYSLDQFNRMESFIKALLDNNPFRAYIELNTKSNAKATYNLQNTINGNMADFLKSDMSHYTVLRLDALVRSVVSKDNSCVNRDLSWVLLDIDNVLNTKSIYKNTISNAVNSIRKKNIVPIYSYETITGIHVILPVKEYRRYLEISANMEYGEGVNRYVPTNNIFSELNAILNYGPTDIKENANGLLYVNMQ